MSQKPAIDRPAGRLLRERGAKRFPLRLSLRFKLSSKGELVREGTGETVDISAKGVLFLPSEPCPEKTIGELSIEWPLKGPQGAMQLVMMGEVVRADERGTAMSVLRYAMAPSKDMSCSEEPLALAFHAG